MSNEIGVLLIAVGHKNYGKMAVVLAASLKVTSPEVPICVCASGDALLEVQKHNQYFDIIKIVKESCFTVEGKIKYFRTKLFMYQFSPFNKTIYLDVDMIWSQRNPITKLFEAYADLDFTMTNEGSKKISDGSGQTNKRYSFWADFDAVKEQYADAFNDESILYQFRSELMYFVKSAKMKAFFALSKQIYDNPKVKVDTLGGCTADEFAFNVAAASMNLHPHKTPYVPLYWFYMHGQLGLHISTIQTNFFAYSVHGNILSENVTEQYDTMAKVVFNHFGNPVPYKLSSKREYLTERSKL